ncbi:hypothetical protein BJV77DRAFT_441885 [Russula vinacea]|jgi:hypothetical protein|nr:hypothetical protein BJV77DRAFT_441885 [Russula vinacea]
MRVDDEQRFPHVFLVLIKKVQRRRRACGGVLAMVRVWLSASREVPSVSTSPPPLAPNPGNFHVAFAPPTPGRHPRSKRETDPSVSHVATSCYLYDFDKLNLQYHLCPSRRSSHLCTLVHHCFGLQASTLPEHPGSTRMLNTSQN